MEFQIFDWNDIIASIMGCVIGVIIANQITRTELQKK